MQIHELNNYNGDLDSAFLALDNGNDTGKATVQYLLAAINARIDNIIAGEAPSAAEVTDARLGANGVTYPSLGDAIREQIDAINENVLKIQEELFTGTDVQATSGLSNAAIFPNGTIQSNPNYDAKYWIPSGDYKFLSVNYDLTPQSPVAIGFFSNNEFSEYNLTGSVKAVRNGVIYPVPDGTTYIALSCPQGATPTVTFYVSKAADNEEEIAEILSRFPIQPKDAAFFYKSYNLANPNDFVVGEYVNPNTGDFPANDTYERTGFVSVEGDKDYFITNQYNYNGFNIFYAFFDNEKRHISGGSGAPSSTGGIIHSPAGAKYVVVSAIKSNFRIMIAQSSTAVSYEDYDTTYILPEFIIPEDMQTVVFNLPSKIYALPGLELNIYFENLVEDWERYYWDVECSKGMQLERGFRYTPANGDAGSYPLTITIRDSVSGKSSKTMSTTLVVGNINAGSGETKSVIILGDSTTANGIAVGKLHSDFDNDVMSIQTLGTQGTAPNNHEGRSGWTFAKYFSTTNPFLNPQTLDFDAAYYFANSGVTKPDWFFINLGINDFFANTTDGGVDSNITSCLGYCDDMIESVLAASPNTKIGVCITIPPNSSQDAFGKAYNCDQTRDRYKRNNLLWANALISHYEGQENNGVYLVPIFTNLDTVYNMGLETIPVNSRSSVTYQTPIGNGGVHPSDSGYWQIADIYAAFIKANV